MGVVSRHDCEKGGTSSNPKHHQSAHIARGARRGCARSGAAARRSLGRGGAGGGPPRRRAGASGRRRAAYEQSLGSGPVRQSRALGPLADRGRALLRVVRMVRGVVIDSRVRRGRSLPKGGGARDDARSEPRGRRCRRWREVGRGGLRLAGDGARHRCAGRVRTFAHEAKIRLTATPAPIGAELAEGGRAGRRAQ